MTLRRHAGEIVTAVQLVGYDDAMKIVEAKLHEVFEQGRRSGNEEARQALNRLGEPDVQLMAAE